MESHVAPAIQPKVTFRDGLLPQFVDIGRGHVAIQIAFLGLLFTLLGFVSDGCYAFAASAAGNWLKRSRSYLRVERYVSGVLFIGLGVTAALAGNQKN